jgi:cell division septation protein DedD
MREELDIPMPAMGPGMGAGGTGARDNYRVSRRSEGIDPNTRRLAMIAGGIGGAFALLVGVYSLSGHHGGGVPVVQADSRPLRVKPENAGGMQVAGADDSVMSGAGDAQAKLAPAPEVPAPNALRTPAPSASTSPVQPASLSPAQPAPAPGPVAALPEPKPAAKTAAKPAPAPATAQVAPAAPAGHGPVVQLGALGTEQAAMTEWQRLEKKMPDVFGGRKPMVSKIEHDGKTFFRLRTGGFADATAAKGFCEQVKAKGGGCAVSAS